MPDLVAEVTERTYEIGPFKFSPTGINWDDLTNELVSAIQPAIGRLGTLVGSVAAGALGIITGTILVVLISYFLLAESPGFSGQEFNPRQTSYTQDLQRINTELNRIWSAFIRSELLVVLISYVLYTISLGVMGVQFFVGLAAIAAFGQLIPYVGAWVTWISFGLVALFQTNTPFGLPAGIYTIIVLAVSMVINGIIDNIIRTKVMSSGLKVHPALVLISAIISVQLFGFIGIVIAAPIVASFKLFLIYAIKKLNDQNPFEGLEVQETVEKSKWALWLESFWQKLKTWIINLWRRLWKRPVQKAQRVESTQPDTVAEEGRD